MAKIFGIDEKVLQEVKEIFKETNIEEIEFEEPEKFYLYVSRKKPEVQVVNAGQVVAAPAPIAIPTVGIPVASTETPSAVPAGDNYDDEEKYAKITSPVIGTYYESPSPDAPAFVKPGDTVSPDTTVCIVEAMKVMNEIEAEFGGVIMDVLAENGQPVEAEAIIFLVDPD